MLIQNNVSLKPYHTFHLAINASQFIEFNSEEELLEIIQKKQIHTPWMVIGEGSNLLFTTNYPGLILKNNIQGITVISNENDNILVSAGAGEKWDDFVRYLVENNYYGAENLSAIPGTVGAAPVQNIGAYGAEAKDIIHEVIMISIKDSHLRKISASDCNFSYRDSIFKHELKDEYIITRVVFRLHQKPNFKINYAGIQEVLEKKNIINPQASDIRQTVIELRNSKLPNPSEFGNAGSFFKNPEVTSTDFQELKLKYPTIPNYPGSKEGFYKIAAGWLIEQCGFKGQHYHGAGVWEKQALIIVNYQQAKPQDIINLMNQIKNAVLEKFQISLETEVNII